MSLSNPNLTIELLELAAEMLAAQKREKMGKPYKPMDHQRRPDPREKWRYHLFLAGRGAGKTRYGVEFVMDHLRALGPRARVGIMAPTHQDGLTICLEGESGLYTNYFHEFKSYHKTNRTLIHRDGGRVVVIGAEMEGRWRGHNWTLIWVDELAQCHQPSIDHAILGLRTPFSEINTLPYNVPNRPVLIATTTPLPIQRIIEWADPKFTACHVKTASTFDNAENLDEATLQSFVDLYGDTTLGRQELYAEILDKIEGARWTWEMLERDRLNELPQVVQDSEHTELVVAIDPAASIDADADKTAITAILKGYPHEKVSRQGRGIAHYYVLDAWAAKATPYTWSKQALQMYLSFHADQIIGEKNNGGEMVRYTIESTVERMKQSREWPRGDLMPRIKLVHASRGKKARTDPIIALYEQRRCIAEGSLVETARGPVPIEQVTTDDYVWTRKGLRRVLWGGQTGVRETVTVAAKNGARLALTPDHPVYVSGRGFVHAGLIDHTSDTLLAWERHNTAASIAAQKYQEKRQSAASLALQRTDGPRLVSQSANMSNSMARAITDIPSAALSMVTGEPDGTVGISCSTEPCGNTITGQSLTDGTSTTATGTHQTTPLRTLLRSRRNNTAHNTRSNSQTSRFDKWREHNASDGNQSRTLIMSAKNVAPRSGPVNQTGKFDSVPQNAIATTGIVSVEPSGMRRVYDLTIEGEHEFFANGILVHNCHHVGRFPVLETEMTRYPVAVEFMDPIDSLTWGISSLADLHTPEWMAI